MLVKNIKFKNDKIEIILDNKSFFISKENYIENPIAIDSDISEEKISYLLEYEIVVKSKLEMIKLLSRKTLSEYEIYIKLKDKNLKSDYVKKIIEELKRMGLINDEFTAIITSESMLLKRKGKKEIRKSLKEKKVSEEIINKIIGEIDENVYLENFNKLVNKYMKIYENKSYRIKENMIRKKLEEAGYEEEFINGIEIINNREKEIDLAKNFLLKIIKNKNVDLNSYENINKIKSKLIMKGFNYDIINLALEEVKKDEIN